MRKGIAIRTILLLVIGVLVAGIVIYLVYRYVSGSVISEAECTARLSEICQFCKNTDPAWSGWGGSPFFGIVNDCASYPKFSAFQGSNNCGDLENPCKMIGIE